MNVKLRVGLNRIFHVYRLAAPIFACALFNTASPALLAAVAAAYLAPLLLAALIPLDCNEMGCTGRMQVTEERLSFWTVSMYFKCDHCEAAHEAEIFNPNFVITSEYS